MLTSQTIRENGEVVKYWACYLFKNSSPQNHNTNQFYFNSLVTAFRLLTQRFYCMLLSHKNLYILGSIHVLHLLHSIIWTSEMRQVPGWQWHHTHETDTWMTVTSPSWHRHLNYCDIIFMRQKLEWLWHLTLICLFWDCNF